ncbi:hypothetical protein BGX23_010662, partial [Mortierella sp. AD031]
MVVLLRGVLADRPRRETFRLHNSTMFLRIEQDVVQIFQQRQWVIGCLHGPVGFADLVRNCHYTQVLENDQLGIAESFTLRESSPLAWPTSNITLLRT